MGKLAYFLTLMLLATAVQVSFGASGYVNLGTSAPPTTIGPFSVTPFNTAPNRLYQIILLSPQFLAIPEAELLHRLQD